jgi:hypothetical protein
MVKANKLQKEVQMAQVEVQNFLLQINTDWEAITMANQAKVKLYDQLIEEGHVELVDISNEDETIPFSYFYSHNTMKEELGNEKIGINKV